MELVEDELADRPLLHGELEALEPIVNAVDRERADLRDVLSVKPHRPCFRVEPRPAAVGTGHRELILAEEHADVLLVALFLEPAQERKNPDVLPLLAVQQLAPGCRGELAPRGIGVGTERLRRRDHEAAPCLVARLRPWIDSAFADASPRVRHYQRLVILERRAEPVAGGAGTARAVERKEDRRDRRAGRITAAARRVLGEAQAAAVVNHDRDTIAFGKRGRDRFGDPGGLLRRGGQPVDHDQQLIGVRQVGSGRQLVQPPGLGAAAWRVDQYPHESERLEVLDDGLVAEPGRQRQREGHLEASRDPGQDFIGGVLRSVAPDHRVAPEAVSPAESGPEEAKVVVDLRGRSHRGAAGNGRIPLLDGYRRSQPVEPVYERLRHAVEELLGVGRERLDVPPLALGVDGIEGKRGFARPGGAGYDHERAVRQVYCDALQIVLTGVDDANEGRGGHAGRIAAGTASG